MGILIIQYCVDRKMLRYMLLYIWPIACNDEARNGKTGKQVDTFKMSTSAAKVASGKIHIPFGTLGIAYLFQFCEYGR